MWFVVVLFSKCWTGPLHVLKTFVIIDMGSKIKIGCRVIKAWICLCLSFNSFKSISESPSGRKLTVRNVFVCPFCLACTFCHPWNFKHVEVTVFTNGTCCLLLWPYADKFASACSRTVKLSIHFKVLCLHFQSVTMMRCTAIQWRMITVCLHLLVS